MTPIERLAARVIVIEPQGRVLLFASALPNGAEGELLWVAPGGALEPGETWEQAARRELREETGFDLPLGPCVWHREHTWYWPAHGAWYRAVERFFVARTEVTDIDTRGWTPEEREASLRPRWWTVDELAASREVIAPRSLAQLLPPLLAGQLPAQPILLTE